MITDLPSGLKFLNFLCKDSRNESFSKWTNSKTGLVIQDTKAEFSLVDLEISDFLKCVFPFKSEMTVFLLLRF